MAVANLTRTFELATKVVSEDYTRADARELAENALLLVQQVRDLEAEIDERDQAAMERNR